MPKSVRPAVPTPDGREEWYRISNSLDEGGSPVASISLYGDIGSWGISAASFVDELKAIDAPELRLYISSPGGEIYDGLACYNALRSHRARVIVQVDSLAASIASVIAMAGDRVIMSPHSQLMIHDAATVAQGNPEELREMADFLDRQSDNIAAVYQERAGGTVKQWRSKMKAETWYFADEAVAAGLADEVAKPMRMPPDEDEDMPGMDRALAASWDLRVYNYAHASREDAPAPELPPVDTASPMHHTSTVDSPWDGSVQERRLPSPMTVATAKKMYGWYDQSMVENGELPKSAGKLPHHEVDGDGTPGAANLAGVRNALARLPQSDIPEAQRAAVEAHLRAHLADGGGGEEDQVGAAPVAVAFDPAAFRAATVAALDPMPGYQPEHMRSLMAGVAGDAPAAPPPVRAAAVYVPPPVDVAPGVEPRQVAVDYWRSLFTAAANDAPAAPTRDRPAPAAPEPLVVYVPEPPPPAGQVLADYLRAVMTGVANDAPAPAPPAVPELGAPDPVPTIDRTAFGRALLEARL
jgi:ATP-dependent protease ClpP protease subunit